ncbi:MAG: hypothetical protein SWH61_03295 [Thermodesulfobacteriota bacterium]|nr:hypothetical protein [Thermodesulfobacteriota bacterium]
MRQSKTITIDDDKITVYELTVEEVLSVIEDSDGVDISLINEHLSKCTNLSFEKMKKMAPSELKQVWAAFQEVNAVFFSIIEKTGVFQQVRPAMQSAFAEEMAKSLPGQQLKSGCAGSSNMDT